MSQIKVQLCPTSIILSLFSSVLQISMQISMLITTKQGATAQLQASGVQLMVHLFFPLSAWVRHIKVPEEAESEL